MWFKIKIQPLEKIFSNPISSTLANFGFFSFLVLEVIFSGFEMLHPTFQGEPTDNMEYLYHNSLQIHNYHSSSLGSALIKLFLKMSIKIIIIIIFLKC